MDINEAFEPKYGMPIVHEKEIHWLQSEEELNFEGPCLVEYNDNSVKQSYIPSCDFRIPAAMTANRVKGDLMPPVPDDIFLTPITLLPDFLTDVAPVAFPAVCLILIYLSVQYMNWLKGDYADRLKIRQKEREDVIRQLKEEREEADGFEDEIFERRSRKLIEELNDPELDSEIDQIRKLFDRARERFRGNRDKTETKKELTTKEEKERREQQKRAQAIGQEEERKLLTLQTLKIIKPQKKKMDITDEKELKLRMKQLKRKMGSRGMKLQYADSDRVTFDDIAGVGNAKFEVMEVVDFFTNPKRFRESGARIPRGVLLCGPPGCGKTMLARAVAGEAGVSFLSVNASEFVEMFVGVGASRVRDLFAEARKNAPSIIFIDEIDAVGRVRGGTMGNDERDQTVNQLLSEMDGFVKDDEDVVVMAATNRKDVLDPALIRAGRFDRIVYVGLPDLDGRMDILQTYLDRIDVKGGIDKRALAFQTQRTSGASLANLVNTACIVAGRDGRDFIVEADLMRALDMDRLGPSRPAYSDGRQRRLAVHEAATALLATLLPSIEPVSHVTIIPRERHPIGQTVLDMNEGRELAQIFTRKYLSEQLLMVLASRAAEEIYYGFDEMSNISQRNIVMARRIVQKLLISDNLEVVPGIGHRVITFPVQLGRYRHQNINPWTTTSTYAALDKAMGKRLNDAYAESKAIVARNKPALEKLISMLVKKNHVNGEDVRQVVNELGNRDDLERRDAEVCSFL